MARGTLLILHLGFALAQTCCFEKNLVHTRKKDLTFFAFARILAQEPPSFFHLAFALAPARQNCRKIQKFLVERVSRGTFPNQDLQKSLDSLLLVVVVYNVPILPDYLFL